MVSSFGEVPHRLLSFPPFYLFIYLFIYLFFFTTLSERSNLILLVEKLSKKQKLVSILLTNFIYKRLSVFW